MKNTVVIFLFLLIGCFYFSCQHKPDIGQMQLTGKICLDSKIDSMLQIFIKKHYCDSCTYELYIDKKDPFEYKLTMRSVLSTENYIQENHPVNYTSVDGSIVFIYSGVEDFINGNTSLPQISTRKTSKIECLSSWSYVILRDTSYLIENINQEDYPFVNARQMPTVYFKAPK